MTLNRDIDYRNFSTAMGHILRQWSMQNLHTCLPGIIHEFDATTRRASVRPGLYLVLAGDEPGEDGDTMERALCVNVPVMFPACKIGTLWFPLEAGDRGMLFFSERGMTVFKSTGDIATPDKARFFDTSDAVFLPFDFGFPQDFDVPDEGAMCLTTYDGATNIQVKPGSVRIEADTVHIESSNTTIVSSAGTAEFP